MNKEEIDAMKREDRILSHLEKDEPEPAGFARMTRTRPSRRPINVDRRREDTRRPKREGKW